MSRELVGHTRSRDVSLQSPTSQKFGHKFALNWSKNAHENPSGRFTEEFKQTTLQFAKLDPDLDPYVDPVSVCKPLM